MPEPDEKNLALLRLGQPAKASADAFPDERFEAKVIWIAPSIDPDRARVIGRPRADAARLLRQGDDALVAASIEAFRRRHGASSCFTTESAWAAQRRCRGPRSWSYEEATPSGDLFAPEGRG